MIDIFTNVMNSRRLRRFLAFYTLAYLAMCVALNFVGSFFEGVVLNYLFKLLNYTVQAPFIFGCVRGIVTKDLRFGKGIAAFGEVDKYPFYLAYILLNTAYDIVYSLVSDLSGVEGAMATVGTVLLALMLVIRVLMNFLSVGVYFNAIFFDGSKPVFSISRIFGGFRNALTKKPGRVVAAEVFMLVANFLSLQIAVTLAQILPTHNVVPFILTCLSGVQFGFIILTWPIYYLYCRETYGIDGHSSEKML